MTEPRPAQSDSNWTPVCEVCHGRPKMDRSVCCEECWYSGRYARALRRAWGPSYEAFAQGWLDADDMEAYDRL